MKISTGHAHVKFIKDNYLKLEMNNEHLIDYSESPFSKVIATKKHINNILKAVYKKCNTVLDTPTSKKIDIELRTWKKFIKRQYIKSLTYERLCHFCDFSEGDIRKGIHYIDDIEYPNIPLDFSCKEGVRLDAGVINEGRVRSRIVEYTNKDREVLDIIKS